MDSSQDIAADLSPLEQRRARLRAFADRVLEAVEALPMPKTAIDSERTLRAITSADRMLVQIYSKVTRQQQPLEQTASRAPRSAPVSSMPASLRALLYPEIEREPGTGGPEKEGNALFVCPYDEDEIDDDLGDAPEEDAEPMSASTQAYLDLEQQANEIFAQYLAAIAENPDSDPP